MRKILLDTNTYSEFTEGNMEVIDALSEADIVYMSIFTLGELYTGFNHGSRFKKNNLLLNRFLEIPTVQKVNATQETSQIFGEIKADLLKKGRPLPINDVWIAAHAIETGSTLVTCDKHFKEIDGLRIWDF